MLWLQDVRFALRMIRKNPWFCAAIVVTLALGMGANTTVFSLVNAVLFKPLPFPGGERLVIVSASQGPGGRNTAPVSYADYKDFRDAAGSFERLEAFNQFPIIMGERGNPPERYRCGRISPGMFDMLQMKPVIGRGMRPEDGKPGAEPVILIGYGVWKDRYGMDPSVVGRAVRANEKPAVIIGVMPEGFKFPNNEDLWMPLIPAAADEKRDQREFRMIGMIKKGESIAAAHADLSVVAKRLENQFPATNKDFGVTVQTFHEAMNAGPIRLVFLLMLGAVGFVLLIACANVANMLLSRAVDRTREVSIRAAMGASRWRLIRQLLIEAILLSAAGGMLGLGLARFGIEGFGRAVENVGKPYWIDFSMNYVVFGYFAALTIVAGIVFGIAPALSTSRVNLNETLKDGSRGASSLRGGYLTGALVVFQFTLAVVLLSGAGLMIRSFLVAQSEFSELNPATVFATRVTLPEERYRKVVERQQFFETLTARLSSLPGASSVALVSSPPANGARGWRFEIEGKPVAEERQRPAAVSVTASSRYFRVLGVNLLRGKDFDETDGFPGKETVIVSAGFATKFFPSQDPLGKQIRLFDREKKPRPWMTIIGIGPNIRQRSPDDPNQDPVFYLPYRFENDTSMAVMIRTSGSPDDLTSAVRREVQQLDQDLPLFDTMSLDKRFARGRWHLRVFGTLFFIFALVALGMAAVGVYAVMANAANRRTREIGVRMALGAGAGSIVTLVLGRGVKQLVLGTVLGLGAALAICQLMSRLLFGVSPNDPVTFITVAVALTSAGLLATWIPARRAARLDPVKALRYE
jgi:predicted permease